jgi:hypothetical protein
MTDSWQYWIGVGSILGLTMVPASHAGRLQANVLDDATGQPVAARVAITDAGGNFVEIAGDHAHVRYLDKRWCYVDGGFTARLPDSDVILEIRRGLETLPVKADIARSSSAKTLEIVCNGAVIGHKTLAIQNNPAKDGVHSMDIEATVDLDRSSWLAARVADHPDLPNRILPRDVPVFAHTSPVYFLRDGRNVREEASILYLQKYVEGLLHWLGTNPSFFTEEDRQHALRDAEEALRFYRESKK